MKKLKISDFKLSLDDLNNEEKNNIEEKLFFLISKNYGWSKEQILSLTILKRSLDARGIGPPKFCFQLEIQLRKDAQIPPNKEIHIISSKKPAKKTFKCISTNRLKHPPIIIGAGPAGLFSGYRLAQQGYRPLILERGPEVKKRSNRWFLRRNNMNFFVWRNLCIFS